MNHSKNYFFKLVPGADRRLEPGPEALELAIPSTLCGLGDTESKVSLLNCNKLIVVENFFKCALI